MQIWFRRNSISKCLILFLHVTNILMASSKIDFWMSWFFFLTYLLCVHGSITSNINGKTTLPPKESTVFYTRFYIIYSAIRIITVRFDKLAHFCINVDHSHDFEPKWLHRNGSVRALASHWGRFVFVAHRIDRVSAFGARSPSDW